MRCPNPFRIWLVMFVLASTDLAAQQGRPWETKDWQQWTKEDCERILTDSPWSKRIRASWEAYEEYTEQVGGYCTEPAWYPGDTPYSYPCSNFQTNRYRTRSPVVISYQFAVALPVRLARRRLQQIEAGFGAGPQEQREQLEAQAAQGVNNYDDVFVLNIQGPRLNSPFIAVVTARNRGILPLWTSSIRFNKDQQEVEAAFPRFMDGQPVLQAGEYELRIMLGIPRTMRGKMAKSNGATWWGKYSKNVEATAIIPISEMEYAGRMEY